MDDEVKELLKGSIEKWESIRDKSAEDRGSQNCPLCQKFLICGGSDMVCKGCPVAEFTGKDACDSTPYEEWTDHHHEEHVGIPIIVLNCGTCTSIVDSEITFLKHLLEE